MGVGGKQCRSFIKSLAKLLSLVLPFLFKGFLSYHAWWNIWGQSVPSFSQDTKRHKCMQSVSAMLCNTNVWHWRYDTIHASIFLTFSCWQINFCMLHIQGKDVRATQKKNVLLPYSLSDYYVIHVHASLNVCTMFAVWQFVWIFITSGHGACNMFAN